MILSASDPVRRIRKISLVWPGSSKRQHPFLKSRNPTVERCSLKHWKAHIRHLSVILHAKSICTIFSEGFRGYLALVGLILFIKVCACIHTYSFLGFWLVESRNVTSSRRSLRWMSLTKATYLLQQKGKTNDERLSCATLRLYPTKLNHV